MTFRRFRAYDATDSRRVLRAIEHRKRDAAAREMGEFEPFAHATFIDEVSRTTTLEERERVADRLHRIRRTA